MSALSINEKKHPHLKKQNIHIIGVVVAVAVVAAYDISQ